MRVFYYGKAIDWKCFGALLRGGGGTLSGHENPWVVLEIYTALIG